ncbi:hypothetical protein KIPB_014366, partial [Kipferlia bialata]
KEKEGGGGGGGGGEREEVGLEAQRAEKPLIGEAKAKRRKAKKRGREEEEEAPSADWVDDKYSDMLKPKKKLPKPEDD